MLGKSISRNSITLSIFALVTAGILAVIFTATNERIALQEKIAAEKALLEIIPRVRHDNDMLASTWDIPIALAHALSLAERASIHIATSNNRPIAAIIPSVAPDGYSGAIKMLVGINIDGTIAGVRVVHHKETPGLGDKVDLAKSSWILGFNDRSLTAPEKAGWKVKKDGGEFDQFTGATITPRAVVQQVQKTLLFFEQHKQEIFNEEAQVHSLTNSTSNDNND